MDPDTRMGGPVAAFPKTRGSVIVAAAVGDAGQRALALDRVVALYWKPAYKYFRIKWRASNEEAKDLTQAFFAKAIEREFFAGFDPARASFRTYLRTCLDHFAGNERKAAGRLKRGGDTGHVPLDFEDAEAELARSLPAPDADVDTLFYRETVRALFARAVERLRGECAAQGKAVHVALFEQCDLDADDARPSYGELARRHSLPVTQVNNYLSFARRQFRRIVLEEIRALTGSDDEYRAEAKAMLGIDPGAPR